METVWLASYPRSGNTLARAILARCLGVDTGSIYPNDLIKAPAAEQFVRAASSPVRAIKTHDAPQDADPAIYVVRDGRASVVSYWHHLNTLGRPPWELRHLLKPWKRPRPWTLADVIRGKTRFGSWSGHIEAWDPLARSNTLLVRYEDMTARPDETAARMADFLSVPVAARFDLDFKTMHAAEPKFFRRGDNEASIDEFDSDDAALFERLHGEAMRALGYPTPI